MKKAISVLLFVLTAALCAAFVLLLRKDYTMYYPYGSSPFYLYVIERGAECLLPAAACLTVGIVLLARGKKQ